MNPITYCMNVHKGESLDAILQALKDVTLPLREVLGERGTFPVGLRFGAQAAKALRVPETVKRFSNFLLHNNLAVMGINGFPYGAFHDESIKTSVYQPDWTSPERTSYTRDLFYALSHLPIARMGDYPTSVTTVPLAYDKGQGISESVFEELCAIALFLRKLEGFTGKRMCLALEPEPDCLLESTQTTIDFFERLWQHPHWIPAYRHYIGVCFDTCHFAVGYEDPLNALRNIVSANIPVARIQISAALEFNRYTTAEDLQPFIDKEYLHQTRRREENADLTCFEDLTETILPKVLGASGRIHYHVPLAWNGTSRLESTRRVLTPAFWRYVRAGGWPLEIETYTYFVYPESLRTKTLSEWLLDDILWVKAQLRSV
ncbi:MAG: metabolite traffic protein EboE [Kiritimatiellae bacterium]|nr:metabolite traffic protein EboE [Kiritimatiellia bacterium]